MREIATATGRTVATVRYHLHQISQKRGISRQADLVRLVLSLAEWRMTAAMSGLHLKQSLLTMPLDRAP